MTSTKSILIFGTGQLQRSIIERCSMKGFFTVGIDPNQNAECKDSVNAFEVVDGDDFEGTVLVARKYNISGLITAATDKPLVMMARVAEELNLPFFSVETAKISTDKLLMKQKFLEVGLPCAKGYIISDLNDLKGLDITFPVIVKPRDNSGSRGVIYCDNYESAALAINEASKYTKKNSVLIEEFIEGQEYSVEGIHKKGEHNVVQITEKTTTAFPYNVELGHIQPANITVKQQSQIRKLISKIAHTLEFENCASHTEIKINSRGLFIIETSPRLGGDFISSTLVPLSTGINMEDTLIDIATSKPFESEVLKPKFSKYAGIKYLVLPEGIIKSINNFNSISSLKGVIKYQFELRVGDTIKQIRNSNDRYGYVIICAENKCDFSEILTLISYYEKQLIII